jgi:hypothetical protein
MRLSGTDARARSAPKLTGHSTASATWLVKPGAWRLHGIPCPVNWHIGLLLAASAAGDRRTTAATHNRPTLRWCSDGAAHGPQSPG